MAATASDVTRLSSRDTLVALGESAQVLDVSVRPREDPDERGHRQRAEAGILWFGGVVMMPILAYAMVGAWSSNVHLQKASTSLLGSILAGVVGFLSGRALKGWVVGAAARLWYEGCPAR